MTRRITTALAVTLAAGLMLASATHAATVQVTQNTASWTADDTRGGGTQTFTNAYGAPPSLGTGSLQLATTNNNADKAGLYTHTMAGTLVSDITALSYWTFQSSPNNTIADPSYQLQIDVDGTPDAVGFTTLVFEPYQNAVPLTPIQHAVWQQWDVDAGTFWSSRTTPDGGNGQLIAGAGGPPFYTLADVVSRYPNAVVVGVAVNVGTFNPAWTVATDGVQFNDTTYNFEVGLRPATKDDCKKDGWKAFNDPAFTNQGDCVSYVATGGRNPGNG
jgi:hypothetical protein